MKGSGYLTNRAPWRLFSLKLLEVAVYFAVASKRDVSFISIRKLGTVVFRKGTLCPLFPESMGEKPLKVRRPVTRMRGDQVPDNY